MKNMKQNSTPHEIWHLINNPDPRRGGAQKILEKLAAPGEKILSKQPPPHRALKILPSTIFSLIQITIKIANKKPDLAYIHSRCFLPLTWIFKAAGTKTIFYAHANYRRHSWLYKVFPCDHYVAVSGAVRDSILKQAIAKSKVSTIVNPYIGGSRIGTCSAPSGAALKIGFVGSLNIWKGILDAIKAIYAVSSQINGRLVFQIIGDGPLMQQVKELASTTPKNVEVIISGYQEAPFEVLKDAQALLIPSLEEGFGLVAIEGIYQGKIVLHNAIPSLSEICDSDALSYSFNINDSATLLAAINQAQNFLSTLNDTDFILRRSDALIKTYGLERFVQEHKELKAYILH
ncbi:glycosyltransferase family 4 protein [Pseudomonas sp. R3.Fl]|uniref:glycosyltransferase family 4 protein n=1 Tax=Pseudomonas sp. R3.Fl TaxID=2928708 RepID=UPI00201D7401|nr:glycosyltransferase family 4 protein [Pseudomonas sp. R3.Fl]MCL6688672.1 glycosyltransferase family 4 protein [Pseudomonas sp. R3.Fl]